MTLLSNSSDFFLFFLLIFSFSFLFFSFQSHYLDSKNQDNEEEKKKNSRESLRLEREDARKTWERRHTPGAKGSKGGERTKEEEETSDFY